jgi:transposase
LLPSRLDSNPIEKFWVKMKGASSLIRLEKRPETSENPRGFIFKPIVTICNKNSSSVNLICLLD